MLKYIYIIICKLYSIILIFFYKYIFKLYVEKNIYVYVISVMN